MPEFEVQYVDTTAQLEILCQDIEDKPWLAVDTEFLREKTYFPKFCLLQIATAEKVACIDPIAIEDLSPIFDVLYDPKTTKVLHSGRQDLEIFYNIRGCLPGPVFDTQMAAPLLGLNEQIGYASLVSEVLGVKLVKSHTRTDWSRRPLSSAQISYASDDVYYLAQAYPKMQEQLSKLGRLDWLVDDFSALLDPKLYNNPPEQAWARIRGAQNLRSESLSILQNLAAWREQTALNRNIPRNWVLKDEILVGIARMKPAKCEELKMLRGLHERTVKRYGQQICEIIHSARKQKPIAIDAKLISPRKSPQHDALIQMLTGVVHHVASQYSLGANTLAQKKDLEQLIAGNPHNRLTKGWRKSIIGDELTAILGGQKHISVRDLCLQIGPIRPSQAVTDNNKLSE